MRLHLIALLAATPAWAQPIDPNDYPPQDPAQVELGRLLFHDPILSGNRNIACSTCHSLDHAGGDGLSLGIGEGGIGIGPDRIAPGAGPDRIAKRIPRNAPPLWNLGHRDVRVMFHDGRLSPSDLFGTDFNSPAEEWLPEGLDGILAAQAIFPLTAQFEMAGNVGENEIIGAASDRIDAAWPLIAKRVRTIPAYGEAFVDAYDHVETPGAVDIADIANAIGSYVAVEWESHDSPFDAHLRGQRALTGAPARGMALFFGEAGCASCHSGPLLSDQSFHALGLPAFGPGRTRRFDPIPRDVGRMGESDLPEDAYRFRTPMLRNVELTGPWGHNGAYGTLEGIVRHHLDPEGMRAAWTLAEANLPPMPWIAAVDDAVRFDAREMARQGAALDIAPLPLPDAQVDD
ncbi:MAG: cytochrome c peroxidase, partial [Jannaschia sp.]